MTERFEISKKLGEGGNGTVHMVQGDIGVKRTRALKIVRRSTDLENSEIKGLISLNQFDQHFTRFYGWWQQENYLYLLTEYMEGGDLQTHIGDGPKFIPESKAQIIAKKIIESTVIMHSMGIIHRDLKPGNILLANKDGDQLDIRIGDMGISKSIGSIGNARLAGTQGYMAPEVIRRGNGKAISSPGIDKLNYAPDMWSVGCIIFATLTGKSPYPNDTLIPENDDRFPTDILQYNEVSELGIKFIKSLVTVDMTKRLTAKMALEDRWLLLVDSPPGES
ncbi:Calcium/calmodulin-dependent protein kinase type I [Maublancomyces gigas]|uniref:Autophagy-related protein 1 n=1 Tax=Discina gigas TaxID=1032678 RepID=A0ABR3GAM2_9PEZI